MSVPDSETLARLAKLFQPARPITSGGVVTLSAGLPMTAATLARLEAAWRLEPAVATHSPR